MKNSFSRRQFIKNSALFAGAAASLPLRPPSPAEPGAPAAAPAPVLPPAPKPILAPPGFGVAKGPFQPSWESLANYQVPDWFRDAKFGIWAHWGPQCQPEMGDWYAQRMYQSSNSVYKF